MQQSRHSWTLRIQRWDKVPGRSRCLQLENHLNVIRDICTLLKNQLFATGYLYQWVKYKRIDINKVLHAQVASILPIYISSVHFSVNPSLVLFCIHVYISSAVSRIKQELSERQHIDLELPYTPLPPGWFCKGIFFWKPIQNAIKWAMSVLWCWGV